MYCKNCGVQMNDNQGICIKCGVIVGNGSTYCANCGKELTAGADFCMNCGVATKAKQESSAQKTLGGYDKLVMILISLFLGSIGIHNFMLGEMNKGIMKIIFFFVCGISFIFALIDCIKIATDEYEISAVKYF